MLSLLAEGTFNELKIKGIADKAKVNRVTFYDHYSSKEELLAELIDDVLNEYADIIEGMPKTPSVPRPSAELIKTIKLSVGHIKKHADFYKIMLLTNGVPDFSNRLHDQMSESLHKLMRLNVMDHPEIDFDLFVDWIIGGAIGVYKYWLHNGMRQTEEVISKQLLMFTLSSSQVLNSRTTL
ncbi:TetR/AcrR family transcriptional regulator [Cohnella endophytica]|uniref:TetR/AcrR family transcriptional regulator n=1 Tax=Cohnella endophytica TaxID=2419778 RepID=A0A494Y624_9BACL|nr:TetR/AcrR family transcriptional regulator [Cohnella endophytica]RKP58119.1 TetR/AcrR family transcriptional regulator [Cohnella endophytica]